MNTLKLEYIASMEKSILRWERVKAKKYAHAKQQAISHLKKAIAEAMEILT